MTATNESRRQRAAFLILAGVCLGVLFGHVLPTANADPDFTTMGTVDSSGKFTVATGQMFGRTDGEVIYVWNHELQKLAAYRTTNNSLELLHVRNCAYDFKVQEYNMAGRRSIPSVDDIKKEIERQKNKPKNKPK